MKIAHLNSVYHFGSTGKIVESLNLACLDNEIESLAFYGRKKSDYPNTYFFSYLLNFPIDLTLSFFKDNAGFNSKKVTKRLISKLKEFKPDLIHIHNIHGYYLNLEMLINYLNEAEIKVVMTLHDCWSFTGFQVHFDYDQNDDFEKLAKGSYLTKEYPFRYKVKNNEKNYQLKKELFTSIKDLVVVSPSKYLKSYVDKSFLNKYPSIVINNGIDLKKFSYNKNSTKTDKKIILGVASIWDANKNLKDFIKIVEKLPEDYQGLVVGLSKKQISKLPKKIIGMTRTERVEDLVELYNSAYLFLNPSLQENFPTVNIEALACGLPIVAYDSGGSAEIFEGCGYKVKKGDVNQAVDVIINNDFDSLSEKCQERANRLYSKELMLKKYLQLYKTLVNKV